MLIVDDDELICRQMAIGLSTAGYQVVTAHDGTRAIAQALETPPDVAIVDLEMPTSGLDVIRHLKQQSGPAVHVIVMTGHDDEANRRDAFDAGTDDFVVKPTGLSELKRRLAAATRKQSAFVEVRLAMEVADRRMTYGAEAAALVAHDLNNGLAVALSNLGYLHEEVSLDQDQNDALATTIRSLRRMSGLVANFVDVARFEDAAVKPVVTRVRVQDVLESVLEVNASSITRGVTIKIDCPDGLDARFDTALVERVLHNLVGNASRYCSQGGTITVSGRRWNDPDSIIIAVSNSGPQVPENIRGTLFGKYVRGGGGKRGMGLYFCRLVAEAHSGRIDYEAASEGPCFVLRLPGRS
ncbi:MAG: two component transcriptional regulator [Deltaproteobacteria bacterium]|nr:two component transcriptional regulator [Deltaproteobacteria bacterium]